MGPGGCRFLYWLREVGWSREIGVQVFSTREMRKSHGSSQERRVERHLEKRRSQSENVGRHTEIKRQETDERPDTGGRQGDLGETWNWGNRTAAALSSFYHKTLSSICISQIPRHKFTREELRLP